MRRATPEATNDSRLGENYLVTVRDGDEERLVPLNEILNDSETSPENLVALTDILISSFRRRDKERSGGNAHSTTTLTNGTSSRDEVDDVVRRTRSARKSHVCSVCGAAFSRPVHLRRHVTRAHRELLHKCELCDELFGDEADFLCHVENHGIRSRGCVVNGDDYDDDDVAPPSSKRRRSRGVEVDSGSDTEWRPHAH